MKIKDNYENLIKDFKNLADNDKLFHAYLFFGESIGEIFDFSKKLGNFLETGEFKQTERFLNDFIVIEPNEYGNIGIEEVREIRKFLYRPPAISKKKTLVVHNAAALTDEAQSGILKIIEEPPQKSLLILIANRETSVLDTIRSRVNAVYFSQKADYTIKSGNKKPAESAEKDEIEEFFRKNLSDLGKNQKKNFNITKEVLKRLSLMKQYNLNNKLQLRLLNLFIKKK